MISTQVSMVVCLIDRIAGKVILREYLRSAPASTAVPRAAVRTVKVEAPVVMLHRHALLPHPRDDDTGLRRHLVPLVRIVAVVIVRIGIRKILPEFLHQVLLILE